MAYYYKRTDELYHHGILGQKWGVRRFQNPDGSLTPAGKDRYGSYTTDPESMGFKKNKNGHYTKTIKGHDEDGRDTDIDVFLDDKVSDTTVKAIKKLEKNPSLFIVSARADAAKFFYKISKEDRKYLDQEGIDKQQFLNRMGMADKDGYPDEWRRQNKNNSRNMAIVFYNDWHVTPYFWNGSFAEKIERIR